MKNYQKKNMILRLMIVSAIVFFAQMTQAQTTAFNFQGRLNDGANPANGRYDLQFKLFDLLSGGTQVGPTLNKPNLLLNNGVFSTSLDFGAESFSGGERFIEIALRPTGSPNVTPNAFVILGGRQQILSVPYSVKSLNASNADTATNAVNSTNAANATNATTAQLAVNSQQLGGVDASQYIQKGAPGTVKAMLYVDGASHGILRCYNSTLSGNAATTIPCGFSVNEFTQGGFGINFGFNTANTFVAVTTGNNDSVTPVNTATYATFAYPYKLPQNINVFTWDDGGNVSSIANFMITVY